MGKGGTAPGKAGLPGIRRGLSQSQSQQTMFVAYDIQGQALKVLKPGNVPYKPVITSKPGKGIKIMNTRNSIKDKQQLFGNDDEV